MELYESDFDLHLLLEDVVEMFAQRAEAKGVELCCHADHRVPQFVRGDSDRLRQVLVNLVGNAVKFTAQGQVVVRAFREQRGSAQDGHDVVRFSVADTGIGIPRNKLGYLFQAFSQVDPSTTRQYGGTGLGLAVSKLLVDLFHGELSVESEEGQGSTFQFTAELGRPCTSSPATRTLQQLENLRVLVVDDNLTNLEILQAQLAGWGVSCLTTDDPLKVTTLLDEAQRAGRPFHLAIINMQMPQRDGLQLASEIKGRAPTAETLLIMLTSMGELLPRNELRRLGIAACLTKPVRASRLFETIVSVLDVSDFDVPPVSNFRRRSRSLARRHKKSENPLGRG